MNQSQKRRAEEDPRSCQEIEVEGEGGGTATATATASSRDDDEKKTAVQPLPANERIFRTGPSAPAANLPSLDQLKPMHLMENQRLIINLSGEDVYYGEGFLLPEGFHASLIPKYRVFPGGVDLIPVMRRSYEAGVLEVIPDSSIPCVFPPAYSAGVQKVPMLLIPAVWRGRMLLVNPIQLLCIVSCPANEESGCTILVPSAQIYGQQVNIITSFWVHEFRRPAYWDPTRAMLSLAQGVERK